VPHGATPATLDMVSIRALAEVGQVSQNDGGLIAPEGYAGDTESAITDVPPGQLCFGKASTEHPVALRVHYVGAARPNAGEIPVVLLGFPLQDKRSCPAA